MSMDLLDATNLALGRIFDACDQAAKKQAELGTCQICNERPGDLLIKGNSVCDECDQEHYGPIARLPRFRTREDRDAYEAGVRARGEI